MCTVNARHPIFIITNKCKLGSSKRPPSLRQRGHFTVTKINISIHHYGKRRQKVAEKEVVEGSEKRILQSEGESRKA